MQYAWNMEYVGNMHRIYIYMEYVWNVYGICIEYVWNMYGMRMEYVWNMYGIRMEYVWNMYGICMDLLVKRKADIVKKPS